MDSKISSITDIEGNTMTQQRYMLIFSIGPVQSLITQARKTRDLWLGSYLLAKLMEAAMEGVEKNRIEKQIAYEVVFPANRKVNGYIPDLPNKYIALFSTAEDAEKAANKSVDSIKELWNTVQKEVKAKVFDDISIYTNKDIQEIDKIWNRQINFESFFEVYWVAVPEPTVDELQKQPEKTMYQLWLAKAQKSFDARKLLRDFKAQNEFGEKSTVSGEREVLHGERPSRQAIRSFWKDLVKNRSPKDIDKEGLERLDAIDTIKRFVLYSSEISPKKDTQELIRMDFPSTSSIAAASFVKLLLKKLSNGEQENMLTTVLRSWLDHTTEELAKIRPHAIPYLYSKAKSNPAYLEILKRDGDCFFEATFAPETLQKIYPETKIGGAKAAYALKKLLQAVGARPSPYYALIQMDGDHMGTIINGAKDKDAHSKISEALSTFAHEEAAKIVQKDRPGRLVYAGGDDMIAFFPLIGLLRMVNELQEQYTKTVSEKVPDEKKTQVTASMGIAIAHHFTPLSLVRQAVLEAEQLAKNRYNRNALVVTIMRRSGEQTRVGCHWKYKGLKLEEQPLSLFQEFYELLINDKLSVSSIHILLDEAPALIGLTPDAQQSEIKRVLQRQRHSKGDISDEEAEKLAERIVHLAQAMDKAIDEEQGDNQDVTKAFELHTDTYRVGLVEVLGWLLVMVFLAREEHHLDVNEREKRDS